ncbi:MAG TPA: glycosyltransferase 87 family protein [Candidatus Dormibacteraeota bacterium]|nr:glycosyltransferase 87 family protein [Candidatus Dormibacteraeota bacterium]
MGAFDRLRSYRLSPWGRTWLSRGVALVGFGLLAKILIETGIIGAGGVGGTDANDYWIAANHVANGEPLYAAAYGTYLAYSYPPVFAQLLSPLSALSPIAFVWLWRTVELIALRIAVDSWTRAGVALLIFPPAIAEIETGNVHLVMAAVCALAMRGASLPIAPAGLLKFASFPLAPIGFLRDRRGFVTGVAVAGVVLLASVALAPRAWSDYLSFLGANELPTVPAVALTILPLPVRLALASALAIASVRFIRLAPVAVLLAYPVVWATSLTTLLAVVTPIPAGARQLSWRAALRWRPARPDAGGTPHRPDELVPAP